MKTEKRRGWADKVWHFLWEEDSFLSWLANVVLAFLLIKFIVYPGLGFALSTRYPVVAVVSSSMEHNSGFQEYWLNGGQYYENINISREEFSGYDFSNGFNKGDIIVVRGKDPEDLSEGDVIIFWSHALYPKSDPIIHRVVEVWNPSADSQGYHYRTKGDNWRINKDSLKTPDSCRNGCIDETFISQERVLGTAFFRIPYLGYIKIGFIELLKAAGIVK